ncbi:heme peroxidase [Tanacetum coccineum]
MFEFKIKKPEESSSNRKPWHKDWEEITSNQSENDAIKDDDKYHNNRKGFLEDDESSDDSILIVDPGWDDYSLQALKLNCPVSLCPAARRARIVIFILKGVGSVAIHGGKDQEEREYAIKVGKVLVATDVVSKVLDSPNPTRDKL